MKNMNCKHGLSVEEEVEARNLRKRIESEDEEIIKKINQLYAEWIKIIPCSLMDYLQQKDKILYSAIMRASNRQEVMTRLTPW